MTLTSKNYDLLFIVIPHLFAGLVLIISGLLTSIGRHRANKEWLQEYGNQIFVTICENCGREVEAEAEDFRIHRNYPEGLAYCPKCGEPISFDEFEMYPLE